MTDAYKCDRCEDISVGPPAAIIARYEGSEPSPMVSEPLPDHDLCADCEDAFIEFMTNG